MTATESIEAAETETTQHNLARTETGSGPLKSLLLSEDEAMALLDLCLMSEQETDATKDRAMMKLTALVRRFIAEDEARRTNLPLASEIFQGNHQDAGGQAWTSSLTGLVSVLVTGSPRP